MTDDLRSTDIDQDLYDRLMAKNAARIAAERESAATVSDEELGRIAYYAACTVYTHEDYDAPDWDRLSEVDEYAQESHIVAARAVRAALAPLPVIPQEFHLMSITRRQPDHYVAFVGNDLGGIAGEGTGPTWESALAAAIKSAQDGDA